jgi:LacI family transcriptional regulator
LRSAPTNPSAQVIVDALETQDRLVAEAVRFIWNANQRSLSVKDVVAKVPLARRSLERRFLRSMGRTIREEIARCRIERVKRTLEETSLPIKRVAFMAGFSSAERLCKVFHKYEGLSPLTYRQQCRQP